MNYIISKYLENSLFNYKHVCFDMPFSYNTKINNEQELLKLVAHNPELMNWYESKYKITLDNDIAWECCKVDNLDLMKKVLDYRSCDLSRFVEKCQYHKANNIIKYLLNEKLISHESLRKSTHWQSFYVTNYIQPYASLREKVNFVFDLVNKRKSCYVLKKILKDMTGLHDRFMSVIFGYKIEKPNVTLPDEYGLLNFCVRSDHSLDDFVCWYLQVLENECFKTHCFGLATDQRNLDLAKKLIQMMKHNTIENRYKYWLSNFAREDPDLIIWFCNEFDIIKNKNDVLHCLEPCSLNERHDITKQLMHHFDISINECSECVKTFCFKAAIQWLNLDLARQILNSMMDKTIYHSYKSWLLDFARNDPDMIVWFVSNFNIVDDYKDVLPCLKICTTNARPDVTQWLIEYFDIPPIDQIK